MLPHTVTLTNLDAKAIHQQLEQLQQMHDRLMPDDSIEAQTLNSTLKIMHALEEGLRASARQEHLHH
ncbi:MAG: hypothetical protein HKM02_02675 [Pseudomonadales bacterium]|nr:hypothetical protein [Pseudomonadales bacterium]